MVFRTQLTWCPLERVCHQPPHLVASSETSYVKASSLPSSLISAHTCFLPSFENDQFCLDDSGTMGYFGKKALLWLARVCVSAALQGRKRMWPSLIMAPELSCFLQLQICPYSGHSCCFHRTRVLFFPSCTDSVLSGLGTKVILAVQYCMWP